MKSNEVYDYVELVKCNDAYEVEITGANLQSAFGTSLMIVMDKQKPIIFVYIVNSISVFNLCSAKEIHVEIPKILEEEYMQKESEVERRIFFNKICTMITDCFNQLIETKNKPDNLPYEVETYLQTHAE